MHKYFESSRELDILKKKKKERNCDHFWEKLSKRKDYLIVLYNLILLENANFYTFLSFFFKTKIFHKKFPNETSKFLYENIKINKNAFPIKV